MALRRKQEQELDTDTILKRIKNGDEKLFTALYEAYRKDFLKFGLKYLKDDTQILDTYQDAFIAFYENVRAEKITSLHSSVKTYVFSIGKFMLIKKFKLEIKQVAEEDIAGFEFVDNTLLEREEISHTQQVIRAAIEQLGEKCRQLLVYYYYRKYRMTVIAERLQYKNVNVVKSKKNRCMTTLKGIIEQQNKELG